RTNSAPSLAAKTFAAPTCLSLRLLTFYPVKGGKPLSRGNYEVVKIKVPAKKSHTLDSFPDQHGRFAHPQSLAELYLALVSKV
ncbi:MAG TPA: hypothetical protein VIV66_19055, partial [Pyrinomonadaceae bacterium]